jgi:hypothetical protein
LASTFLLDGEGLAFLKEFKFESLSTNSSNISASLGVIRKPFRIDAMCDDSFGFSDAFLFMLEMSLVLEEGLEVVLGEDECCLQLILHGPDLVAQTALLVCGIFLVFFSLTKIT